MNEYMIIVQFRADVGGEFTSLIPAQRARVQALMEKGVLTSYSLSGDRKMLWLTLLASSAEAADKTIRLLPLYKFMTYDVVELLFHNVPVYSPLRMMMN